MIKEGEIILTLMPREGASFQGNLGPKEFKENRELEKMGADKGRGGVLISD